MSSSENVDKECHVEPNILRVFICGAHSVGKTTLAKEIAKDSKLHLMSEIARNVIKDIGWKREDFEPETQPKRFKELQHCIMYSQAVEEKRNDELGRHIISDRGIDPVVYSLVYLGADEADELLEQPTTQDSVIRYQSSLVFVIKPFPECISEDNIRLRPKMEEMVRFTAAMEGLLSKLNIPYTFIDVLSLEERVEIIQGEINKWQQRRDRIRGSENLYRKH